MSKKSKRAPVASHEAQGVSHSGANFETDYAALEAFTDGVDAGVQIELNKASEVRGIAERWAGEYGKPGIAALVAEAMLVINGMERVKIKTIGLGASRTRLLSLSGDAATALHHIDQAIEKSLLFNTGYYKGARNFNSVWNHVPKGVVERGLAELRDSVEEVGKPGRSSKIGHRPVDIVHTMQITGLIDPNVGGALEALRESESGKLSDQYFLAKAIKIIEIAPGLKAKDDQRAIEPQQRDTLTRRFTKAVLRRSVG